MRKCNVLITMIVLLITSLHAADLSPENIRAGVARILITPPLDMNFTLGGYGARMSKPAQGVHDNIWAKAIVLTNGADKYLLVTMDILALPPDLKPVVIEKLGDKTWSLENTMFLPSHSHASLDMSALNSKNVLNNPYIGVYQLELREFVIDKLVEVIRQAGTDLKPVKIGTSRTVLPEMNRNRRGDAMVDRDLTVTRIDQENGVPLAVLINWTAHPTIMSDEDMLVSAGWPGYLQREMEDWIGQGVTCMYYNGAQGDQSVIARSGGSRHEKAELYGRSVAIAALKLYKGVTTSDKSILAYKSLQATLPAPKLHPDFLATGGEEYGINEENGKYILQVMCPLTADIGALRLGDLLIVGAPGELSYQLGSKIKAAIGTDKVKYPTIGGIANEWISYILTTEQYEAGGYESSVSFYGKELGPFIYKAMLEVSGPLVIK
ncbi:MAG: hypothetical protein E4H13_05270 [Calditrichales bacterium]|nr:MAG: hypothetical protein E4H13_05270 [Calditrichales bacterium]